MSAYHTPGAKRSQILMEQSPSGEFTLGLATAIPLSRIDQQENVLAKLESCSRTAIQTAILDPNRNTTRAAVMRALGFPKGR